MRMLQVFFILLAIGCVTSAIKCYAGNSGKYNRQSLSVCTSISYCLSVKHKSGVQSYSCDGNSFSHLSLCSLFKTKVPANDYFYASQIGSSSTNPRSSRQMVADGSQSCHDGGDIGTVCCCSTDFCNSIPPVYAGTAMALMILFTLL